MERVVEQEWLDVLPCDDHRATGSRMDLRRVNRLLGHPAILAGRIQHSIPRDRLWHLADLGAGDGVLALRLVSRLPCGQRPQSVTLVDRLSLVDTGTLDALADLGCQVSAVEADAFEWLGSAPFTEVLAANLFLHHFAQDRLKELLTLIAGRCALFVACEPRRSWLPLQATRLLGLIGCNEVTRYDAVASVRAGFSHRELSGHWPDGDRWRIEERPAGLFSHLFAARDVLESRRLHAEQPPCGTRLAADGHAASCAPKARLACGRDCS